MTITVKTLSPSEIQSAVLQSNQIASAATRTVTSNQFVFFAAFDGTRNDRDNLALSGDPKSTNVAQLERQIFDANKGNSNVVTGYYKGVGTNGTWDPTVVIPTSEIRATAEKAYSEFNKAASDWLAVNPSGEVRAMLATFSRGGSTGAVFSQILFERGITNPISGDVLVAPGSSLISGGVIMDTVNTGVSTNAVFVGASNLLFTRSENEYRYAFKGLDNSDQPYSAGVVLVPGDHGDNGGGADNGLGALVLGGQSGQGGAVGYFAASGLNVAATPADRLFNAAQAAIHSEGKDSFGNVIWSEYGSVQDGTVRLSQSGVVPPVTQYNPDGSFQTSYLNLDGKLVTNLTEPTDDGSSMRVFAIKNPSTGKVLSQTQVHISADHSAQTTIADTPDGTGGMNRDIDTTVGGKPVHIDQHASATALANGEQTGDFISSAVTINGAAAVNNNLIAASIDEAYPSAKDIILNRGTGEFTHIVAAGDLGNADGTTPSLVALTGQVDWWNSPNLNSPAITAFAGDLAAVLAVAKSRTPLAIATSVASGLSHVSQDPALSTIAGALRVLGNIKGLDDAFKTGNLGRVLTNGGSLSIPALGIFSEYLRQQIIAEFGSVGAARVAIDDGSELAVKIVGTFDGVNALLEDVVAGLPYLNIAVSLAEGDYKGAAISYIAIENPVVAIFLAAIDYFYTVAMEHQYEANGRFVGGANGAITIQVDNVNGGAGENFTKNMQTMLDQTKKQAAMDAERLGQPMGVIAERLPTIEYKRDVMFLRYKDPLSGQDYVRTFDLHGKYLTPGYVEEVLQADQTTIRFSPWGAVPHNDNVGRNADPADRQPNNQIANAKNFFDDIARQYSNAVTASGAIAPLWEVETVNLQRLSGYQHAGKTTEAIAHENGTGYSLYYGAPGDARPGNPGFRNETSQQTATVIALDLNGDGVITVTKKETGRGVLFDVDNDGFAEESDWIGPRDGILVLDRTSSGEPADGQINRGVDLFNDTWVDGARRQLSVLNEIDGDGNGLSGGNLNAQDPVFAHLKVWLDLNGDGVAQDAELQGLTKLTPKIIASYAIRSGATGRFCYQNSVAANDMTWEVAA